MGKELPLARPEEEGWSVLLAITGSGEPITSSYIGDQREEEPNPSKGSEGGKVEDIEAESQSSSKAEGADASPSKKDRRRRGNKDRKSNRGDEGEDKPVGRTAQELGVEHPGSHCDDAELVPHYWIEVEKVDTGSLFQCKLCNRHLWLPPNHQDAEQMGKLMKYYGKTEGYCRFLNMHRPAKILMAKMQYLRRMEREYEDKREFARLVDKVMSDREYDRYG